MAKRKLERFAEIDTFTNVIQPRISNPPLEFPMKGQWQREFFRNDHDIILELGCGRAEYTVYLAEKNPEQNFIGVDIKGNRLWRGAKTAIEKNFTNAGFVRMPIDFITNMFARNEVSGIWITFPDPQPQKSRINKRLTSPPFLDRYRAILKPGSVVHLKTDSRLLFEYTLETLSEQGIQTQQCIENVYALQPVPEILSVQTTYEKLFSADGHMISYLDFIL